MNLASSVLEERDTCLSVELAAIEVTRTSAVDLVESHVASKLSAEVALRNENVADACRLKAEERTDVCVYDRPPKHPGDSAWTGSRCHHEGAPGDKVQVQEVAAAPGSRIVNDAGMGRREGLLDHRPKSQHVVPLG